MGRAIKVSDGRSTTLYTYTPTGKLKSVVDALGNETAYTYDELDNLKSIHRAEGRITDDITNKNENGISINPANVDIKSDVFPKVGEDGHVTLYSYNLAGQLTKVTDALGQEETYEYDQYGRLITKTDRDSFDTTYEYNDLGAVTKVGYADGRSVAFSYDELNHLSEINDWLGKTTLENDIFGRLSKVTDYQDRTVAYEYNSIGEKTKLTYPDGRQAVYTYDEEGRLSNITGNGEQTSYAYDELGRLIEKFLPNGVKQAYSYLPGGNLESMTSTDREGILDKYFYSYNNSGLISGIGRERRDLAAVSGQYEYQYDAIGRLTRSSLNGELRASYEYDAFGNRTSLIESDTQTTYRYDSLDRLVEAKELNNTQAIVRSYDYDKRGNQTSEYVDGLLNKTFTFDATNMLSKVVDSEKGELENQYNGLGFRVASTRPEEKIEYLCDLSRDYYNLLERTVNGETESFIYDKNVISMSKASDNYYYLQDELGSPMYMTGTDGVAVSSYAFDDFGRGIDPFTGRIKDYKNQYSNGIEHLGNKHAYTKEGNIIQPFAFTGYQEDEVSGLMFAQARHYNSENGKFVGEDQIRGFINAPNTQNHYTYCWDNPISLVDRNGLYPNTVDSQTNYENNIDFDANDSDVVVQNNNSNNCEESESVIDTVGKAISKAASYVSNIVDATILKSDWTDYQSVKQLAKNATEQTRMHNPGHSVDLYKSNNFIRNELKAEESLLKSTSSGAKSTAAAMEKVSNKLNALAIAIDVGIGVVDNVENGTYDRIIPDATVDMVATAGVIGCGSLASTIAATGTALALGVSATAATPVLIGAAAGVLAVYGVSKIVDEYKLPDGKTIRQEAKDLYYEGAKK